MPEWLQALARDLGLFSIALVAIGWVIRTIVNAKLDRDIERFKAELQSEAEKLRHDYQLQALEHQVRFADLHARRAKLIWVFHRELLEADSAMRAFVSPLQAGDETTQTDTGKSAGESIQRLRVLERKLRLLLPPELAERARETVKSLDSEWFGAWLSYNQAIKGGQNPYSGPEWDKGFANAYPRVTRLLPQLLKGLEDEFRPMIGVPTSSDS